MNYNIRVGTHTHTCTHTHRIELYIIMNKQNLQVMEKILCICTCIRNEILNNYDKGKKCRATNKSQA